MKAVLVTAACVLVTSVCVLVIAASVLEQVSETTEIILACNRKEAPDVSLQSTVKANVSNSRQSEIGTVISKTTHCLVSDWQTTSL